MDPLQYIVVQGAMDQSGEAYAILENKAPLTIGEITLDVIYVNEKGERKQFVRQINQSLEAGKSANIPLGIDGYKDYNDLKQRMKVSASHAKALE